MHHVGYLGVLHQLPRKVSVIGSMHILALVTTKIVAVTNHVYLDKKKKRERGSAIGKINEKMTFLVDEEIKYWREVLKRVVSVVKALSSRGLAFRGSSERFGSPNNGNYMMALELIAEFDPFLAKHISKFGNPGKGNTSYLSASTCQQFISIMSEKVTQVIIKQLKSAKYYSITVDSTPDVSHVDQLALVLRYVLGGVPVERFVTFVPNPGHKSEELANTVFSLLEKYSISIGNCRGQSYDNAYNMSGCYSGLQARITAVNPLATFAPCTAHSLNLVGKCAVECCKEASDFFYLLQHLYVFFSASSHRWEILGKNLTKPDNVTLKQLSETRWSAREDACQSLKKDWNQVISALTTIQEDATEKPFTRQEAAGLLRLLERLETAVMTTVWGAILQRFNAVSVKLQSVQMDLGIAVELYNSLIQFIIDLREMFDYYEEAAKDKSRLSNYEDTLKRKIKRKVQSDETPESEMEAVELAGRKKFRTETFLVIIDRLKSELEKRKGAYKDLHDKFSFLTNLTVAEPSKIAECAKRLKNYYPDDLSDSIVDECIHFRGFLLSLTEPPRTILEMSAVIYEKGLQEVYPYV